MPPAGTCTWGRTFDQAAGCRDVPGKGKVGSGARHRRTAGHQDGAVSLKHERKSAIHAGTEVGRHLPARPEGSVETSVDVVAGESEGEVGAAARVADGDELPAGLDRESACRVGCAREVRRDLSARPERRIDVGIETARVQAAIRIQAGKREVW